MSSKLLWGIMVCVQKHIKQQTGVNIGIPISRLFTFPPILPSLVLAVFKAPAPSLSHHICYSIIWHPPCLIYPICREAFKHCQALWHWLTVEPRSLHSCSTDSPEWLTLKDCYSKMKIYQVFNAHIKLFVKRQTQDKLAVNSVLSLSSPPPHGLLPLGEIWCLHHACAPTTNPVSMLRAPPSSTAHRATGAAAPDVPTAYSQSPAATASSPPQATPSAPALPAQHKSTSTMAEYNREYQTLPHDVKWSLTALTGAGIFLDTHRLRREARHEARIPAPTPPGRAHMEHSVLLE
ncbi:hypothetical protein DFH09DRAFT_1083984 [Mycena vulgaris]|nr:hypothetical protein DFH09DRAFT_1083984 [Mycena vulgaris]